MRETLLSIRTQVKKPLLNGMTYKIKIHYIYVTVVQE